ncbi:MAG: TrbG/VirB9 family P-type conjugative transfer protein, partial [Gammaproteobacteria bacterium]|nr:TrbG/VirB9 family P-type conjugative transfer protein [Gammaproteobacteria bacterium]
LNRLNFNYEAKLVKGPVPDWYPKMVFNDGKKTYIKFSSQAQESPSLFIGNAKNSRVASYRVQGNYYIVDSVFYEAQLRGGLDNKTYVQITVKKK